MSGQAKTEIPLVMGDILYCHDEAILFAASHGEDLYLCMKIGEQGPKEYIVARVYEHEMTAIKDNTMALRSAFVFRDLHFGEWGNKTVQMSTAVADLDANLLPDPGYPLNGDQLPYLVADEDTEIWGHIFTEDGSERERDCRFVYDMQKEEITHLEIFSHRAWNSATADEIADVQDSLKNANPEAIEAPESHGLDFFRELPEWAQDEPALEMEV